MVAYRLSAQVIGRSTGRSATGAAAYRAACRIEDARTGLTRDYTRKGGVLHTEILAPENAPDWIHDRAKLWNAIELAEKRKDAQLCREILLNLPHELTREQQIELVREFVRDQCVALGMIADIAVHAPHRKGDDRNTHAHVMLSMRELMAGGFGPKARDWNSPEFLEKWREEWARCQNRALERAGRSERVDHRSLEAQGIDREPEPKQGPVATQMEREGRPSKAGDDRREVKARNQQREELRAEAKIIDFEVARIEREERERQQDRQPAPPPKMPPAVIFRQRMRFETWANGRRADLQNRRLGAEGQQGRGHDRQRIKLERQQESTYGQQLAAMRGEAAAITTRQRQGKGLRGLAYRVTGRAERDRQRAAGIKASIGSIEQRKTEQVQALHAEQQADRAELAGRYIGLAVQLEKRIEQRRAGREAEGWIPPEAREATTGQEIGRSPEIDKEAENSPVEGREAGMGETAPGNEQATTAQPEAAREGNSEPAPAPPGWASEAERDEAIRRTREQREAQEREEEMDRDNDDPGREMT